MSDRIKLLPEVVANQIAAGEVVNRPASVIKEMMENAIDAGASSVTVNFRDGGRELIQVVDDGCGMSPIDARMAFDRHATSKISSIDDIYSIRTFGFRGEALPSIAAVAQVELRTRPCDEEMGTLTTIHGGKFISQDMVMCPVGSQFMVKNLFFNVPARRKFMESQEKSRSHIRAEFRRVALCNPSVRFSLYENDAPTISLEPTSLVGRIVDVAGKSTKQNLLEVSVDTSIVKLSGYVGRPSMAMKNSYSGRENMQYLFINGRYFKSQYFYSAILRAYEKLIPEGYTPSYFLYLEVEPERVDVNVHPQKIEVKFADESAIWSIINAAVRESLAKTGAVPMMSFSEDDASVDIPVMRHDGVYSVPKSTSNSDYNPFREGYTEGLAADKQGAESLADFSAPRIGGGSTSRFDAFAGLQSVGSEEFDSFSSEAFNGNEPDDEQFEFVSSALSEQTKLEIDEQPHFDHVTSIGGGYATALYGGRMVIVDLRRAQERLLFDHYISLLQSGESVSQQLLFPEHLTLSTGDYALIEEHAVDFALLGFDIEFSGGGEIEVKGTPADISVDEVDKMIYELLRAFDTPTTAADIRRERVAEVMARSGARNMQRNISHDEASALLERLAATGNVSYSPSGKAIMAEMTLDEIKAKLN